MIRKESFIKATEAYNTFEKNVPAHYFRGSCICDAPCTARLCIGACGFYELFINGERITRGLLSPYISNTDDYIYCDEYTVDLNEGENVIGIILGNGFQNNPGGHIWDFDKAAFRSAPMVALQLTRGDTILLESGENFKVAPSPILSDDYRFGEYYDARYEADGWNEKGFDDSTWRPALPASAPKGELRIADVSPIVKECEIAPTEIIKCSDGYIYDFGSSNAGVCRLTVKGEKGQRIELSHADSLKDGDVNIAQIWFVRDKWEDDKDIVHKDTYVCKGEGVESYQPEFTYHGFRYVKVTGITEEQATKDLLTYLVYHTRLESRGDFCCSDTVANKLQQMTRRSITSNFHHFPTDCPQREKNGWTADAALSCEAALINFDPERNYREWMRNICKAQDERGALPGIVPTGGWGFSWGNGPAWDCVLTYLPYYTYLYRGRTEMIEESADSFMRYLKYLHGRRDEKGLLSIGLGDWCQVGGGAPKAPLVVTDSVIAMDIAKKMAVMFDAVNDKDGARYAEAEAKAYREAIRKELLDKGTMTVLGDCQSSQAMALHYGVFDPEEEAAAFEKLLQLIGAANDHIDVGVLGGRVIFHVLSRFGYDDLAYKMITRPDYPSYGNWIERGATTLWENFAPDGVESMNHHFWGDISAWFIKNVAGINLNPGERDASTLKIAPAFLTELDSASAYHESPEGRISVSWERTEDAVVLKVQIPSQISAVAKLKGGYRFEDGGTERPITDGAYKLIKAN